MADRAVDLPKPSPDDDEDVVDWLSTAQALWARGERSDALVWLRRAAEAAAMAGQPFRASEIGMYVTALEETFGDLPVAPPPVTTAPPVAPVASLARRDADTLVDSVEAFGQLATEVLRSKLTSIEVDIDEDTLIEETPAALVAEQREKAPAKARAAPPPPPPVPAPAPPPAHGAAPGAGSSSGAPPAPPVTFAPASAPVGREAHEAKVIVQVGTVPPPAFGPSQEASHQAGGAAASAPPAGSVRPGTTGRGAAGSSASRTGSGAAT